jgi:two-component sensor histidine kinase
MLASDQAGPAPLPRPGRRLAGWLARPRPLVLYLALFGLVLLLPTLLFSGYLIARNATIERAGRQAQIQEQTRTLRGNLDRELGNIITMLRVLATSPYLDERDFAAFHARAAKSLLGTGSYVVLLDTSLRQILNTRVPYGTALGPPGDPATARRALETRRAAVSGVVFGRVAQQHIVSVAVPVLQDEDVAYILLITRNAGTLATLLREPGPEGDWSVTLVDGEHKIIAQSSDDAAATGTALPAAVAAALDSGSGFETVEPADGARQLVVYDRLILADWQVILTAPLAAFEAPLRDSLRLLLLGGASLLALSLPLAFLFGRIMAQPVRALARMARTVGERQPVGALSSHLQEANEVATALAAAAGERERHEDQIMLLMRELAHRSKNQLAIIQAMAGQTARRSASLEEFTGRFEQRLRALASSTDLLASQAWLSAPLAELVRAQLQPFGEVGGGRIEARGPALAVGTRAAQNLGLALHELATNASKYGALSNAEGRVAIAWQIERVGEAAHFTLSWRERGGPPVAPPTRSGFGQIVIDQMISQALCGVVELEFRPDGLVWRFACPLEALSDGAG